MIQSQKFRANGKLLISAEYFVLCGASALAIPTSRGQVLEVLSGAKAGNTFSWTTKVLGEKVFESVFDHLGKCLESTDTSFSKRLEQIFEYILSKKSFDFLKRIKPLAFNTEIEFSMDWGLGSSSSLISNLSNWAELDPFDFQREIFMGSGYDVACAMTNSPITYSLKEGLPRWDEVMFNPPFSNHLFFIHLNKKQNSRDAISLMKEKKRMINDKLLSSISNITNKMRTCENEDEFSDLMSEHEEITSAFLNIETVKKEKFSDYPGAVKSLGAWGGDFIMVTGSEPGMEYFRKKGFNTIISFEEMIFAPRN